MSAPYSLRWKHFVSLMSWQAFFGPSRVDHLHNPVPYVWISDEETAICMDPSSDTVYAKIIHDGYRKYHPTYYLSILGAVRMLFNERPLRIGLRSVPRIELEFVRLKRFAMDEAIEDIEQFMIEHQMIQPRRQL